MTQLARLDCGHLRIHFSGVPRDQWWPHLSKKLCCSLCWRKADPPEPRFQTPPLPNKFLTVSLSVWKKPLWLNQPLLLLLLWKRWKREWECMSRCGLSIPLAPKLSCQAEVGEDRPQADSYRETHEVLHRKHKTTQRAVTAVEASVCSSQAGVNGMSCDHIQRFLCFFDLQNLKIRFQHAIIKVSYFKNDQDWDHVF